MSIEVKVPPLAESVTDATLLEWEKKVGDTVEQDEKLVDLETDKVVLEIFAPEAGVVSKILKASGEQVTSDCVLAIIDANGQAHSEPEKEEGIKIDKEAVKDKGNVTQKNKPLSPAVQKLVAENNLDISQIAGTGKSGRLTKADVLKFMASGQAVKTETPDPAPVPASGKDDKRVPMTRLRTIIAERLVDAQHTAAILTTFNEVDMKPVMEMRKHYQEQFQKEHDIKLGFMSFFIKASIEALKKFPIINASVDGSDIIYHNYYDIGVAVSTDRGLVVPVLRDADKLSFAALESTISGFAGKARENKLSMDELTGGSFTITNGGTFGSLISTPIINPPQSSILGMHKIQERPVVVGGEIVIRPMMYLALSYDHRIIDGKEAVQFLVTIKEMLEDPARMLLEV